MIDWPYDLLDEMCKRVGLLRHALLPEFIEVEKPPDIVAWWDSEYAQLLMWPVPEPSVETIRKVSVRGSDWLDHSLAKAEKKDQAVIDGYLVLVLPAMPSLDILEELRRIETSTQVCRKHVAWPQYDNNQAIWHRLMELTVIGLPKGNQGESGTGWPVLGTEEEEVWRRIERLGHNVVAKEDIEESHRDTGSSYK